MFRKLLFGSALFVALGAGSAQAQIFPDIYTGGSNRRYEENRTYRDERGTYHYETRTQRVWVPERRSEGLFGNRVIPGHYENRQVQVKVYDRNNRYDNNRTGNGGYYDRNGRWIPDNRNSKWSKHPHGMPPGQRKKYDDRRDDRYDRYDRNGKGRKHDRDDD